MSAHNLEEEASKSDLRSKIREIHASKELTAVQKARRIRMLMSGSDLSELMDDDPPQSSDSPAREASLAIQLAAAARPSCFIVDEDEREATFADEEKGVLGWQHYQRGCRMVAPCCGKAFTCRVCHDAQVGDGHKIDRFAVESLVCMSCWMHQPFSEVCANAECQKSFGRYYCGVCHFVDDHPTKNLFHCVACKLCRVGTLGVSYKHCDVCVACMPLQQFDQHKCIPQTMKSDCPVCHEDMFSSRHSSTPLPCGHWMHSRCLKDYVAHGHQRCPLCLKTILDRQIAEREWKYLARAVQHQPMPPEFASTSVDILCNDCSNKNNIPYHFFGSQCPHDGCGSFNTTRINVIQFPRYVAPNLAQEMVSIAQADPQNDHSSEDAEESSQEEGQVILNDDPPEL